MNAYPKHSYIDVNMVSYYVNLAIQGTFSLIIAWKSTNNNQNKVINNKVSLIKLNLLIVGGKFGSRISWERR